MENLVFLKYPLLELCSLTEDFFGKLAIICCWYTLANDLYCYEKFYKKCKCQINKEDDIYETNQSLDKSSPRTIPFYRNPKNLSVISCLNNLDIRSLILLPFPKASHG